MPLNLQLQKWSMALKLFGAFTPVLEGAVKVSTKNASYLC